MWLPHNTPFHVQDTTIPCTMPNRQGCSGNRVTTSPILSCSLWTGSPSPCTRSDIQTGLGNLNMFTSYNSMGDHIIKIPFITFNTDEIQNIGLKKLINKHFLWKWHSWQQRHNCWQVAPESSAYYALSAHCITILSHSSMKISFYREILHIYIPLEYLW
jgi:hypothetical protein